MGKAFTPLFASENTAAKLLDMRPADFRALVNAGALPGPVRLNETVERWRVEDLDAILQGRLPKPREEFDL